MKTICHSVRLKIRKFSDKNRREYKKPFYVQEGFFLKKIVPFMR